MKHSFTTSSSILQDGRIRPGTYKIKNIVSQTYVDIKDHVREICGRPSSVLEKSRGQVSFQLSSQHWLQCLTTTSGRSYPRVQVTRSERLASMHACLVTSLLSDNATGWTDCVRETRPILHHAGGDRGRVRRFRLRFSRRLEDCDRR